MSLGFFVGDLLGREEVGDDDGVLVGDCVKGSSGSMVVNGKIGLGKRTKNEINHHILSHSLGSMFQI